ncbi:hypothetical protein GF382_00955 [Candidatus Falkowbacteria bacterium]|nr:hypothetical protein [Candidatus Falkowbacteria bacterium]
MTNDDIFSQIEDDFDPETESETEAGADFSIDAEEEGVQSMAAADCSMGPLDVFRAADDMNRAKVLRSIFDEKERRAFIDTYKEEEASQAELTEDDDWNDKLVSGDDYFLLKYIENHPSILVEKEEEVAEALELYNI